MTLASVLRTILWSAAALALIALGSIGQPAFADDEPGTQDPPLVGRYAGSSITYQKIADFDEIALLKAPHDYSALLERNATKDRSGTEWLKLEGRVSRTRYAIPPGRSSLEVLRNYQNALKAAGFESVFDCADAACFAGKLQDPYLLGEQIDTENNVSTTYFDHARYALLKHTQGQGTAYVSILTGEQQAETTAFVIVAETKAMEGDKVAVTKASEMQQQIADTGKVSIYGLQFDFDKAELKPESKPTLDEIAALLNGNGKLRLEIVGHTDNKGSAQYNLDLSARRAASVVAALTGNYGIAPERLSSSGAGMTLPIASNDTDEGRSKNRRVELRAN